MARFLFALSMMGMLSLLAIAPAFAQATTSVKCSDGIVTVATGGGGRCTTASKTIWCIDVGSQLGEETSSATGGCDSNGKAVCNDTQGHGSCTITREKPHKGGITTRPGRINDA